MFGVSSSSYCFKTSLFANGQSKESTEICKYMREEHLPKSHEKIAAIEKFAHLMENFVIRSLCTRYDAKISSSKHQRPIANHDLSGSFAGAESTFASLGSHVWPRFSLHYFFCPDDIVQRKESS